MHMYINFYFKDIEYSNEYYKGNFSCPDLGVECDFNYNRITGGIDVWNNGVDEEELLPIPIWWLDIKLKENGKLNKTESKISY